MSARSIGLGALAGLAGGIVFGVLMHAMGMLGMVAGLIGADSVAVGWGVHLVNSAIIGAVFGALAGGRLRSWGTAAGAGLVYGAVWWVLGGLIIMPLWLGMPAFAIGEPQLWSLVGHLMYGLVTGLALRALSPQARGRSVATA